MHLHRIDGNLLKTLIDSTQDLAKPCEILDTTANAKEEKWRKTTVVKAVNVVMVELGLFLKIPPPCTILQVRKTQWMTVTQDTSARRE